MLWSSLDGMWKVRTYEIWAASKRRLGCQVLDDTSRAYRPSVIFNAPTRITCPFSNPLIINLKTFEMRSRVLWPCEDAKACALLAEA